MINICEGCETIKQLNFPFTKIAGKLCIDQEGCGIDRETYLEIKYCPVCGKKLEKD